MRAIAVLLASAVLTHCNRAQDQSSASSDTPAGREGPVVGSSSPPDSSRDVPRVPTDTLIQTLQQAFQTKNPRLQRVNILERRSFSVPGSGSLVLARAIRADESFSGDFNDELFCVFKTSPDDRSVEAVIHCLPTPRWNDYTLRFELIDHDSIVLMGTDGYGGQGTQVVRWRAPDVGRYVRPEDPWIGAVVEFADPKDMTLYDRPEGARVRFDLQFGGTFDYGMRVEDIRDNWFKVAVWVPSMPGCENNLQGPLRADTLWTPFRAGDRTRLRRAVIGPC